MKITNFFNVVLSISLSASTVSWADDSSDIPMTEIAIQSLSEYLAKQVTEGNYQALPKGLKLMSLKGMESGLKSEIPAAVRCCIHWMPGVKDKWNAKYGDRSFDQVMQQIKSEIKALEND